MGVITSFFKKHWLFIVLAALAFALLGIFLFTQEKGGEVAPSPSPISQSPSWRGITPGQTSQEEVAHKLGQPRETRTENSSTVFIYPSGSKVRNNEVFFTGTTTSLIKEQITSSEVTLSSYLDTYGAPEALLYGPHATAGFTLHVFSSRGVAALANPTDGTVLEVWYFTPMGFEQFQASLGQEFSTSYPQKF
ncbi:hypothetical protein HYV21_02660 [Candidatus Microgenomates bacterium]|nr:hypothetical protein [Candidatus Microgenomates bacterium]